MQTSALYDPRRSASPRQIKEMDKFHQRRLRFEAAAIQASASAPSDKTERSKAAAIADPKPLRITYESMWFYDLVSFAETWIPGMPAVQPKLRIDQIQKAVANFYDVTVMDILSARRTAHVVRPRQIGFFLSKALTTRSLPEIGRRFGDRDHTTALHGIRKIEHLRKVDEKLERELQAIANELGVALA